MLQYEHNRTADIVRRLVDLMRLVRTVIILVMLVGVAGMGALVGEASGVGYLGGGLVGAILGFVLGAFAAALTTIGMEWMAQLLVAQGEIVAALKADASAKE